MTTLSTPFSLPASLGALGLAITATPNNTFAYFLLTVTGLTPYTTITVTRLNQSTGVVSTVRAADAISTGGQSVLAFFDYEAPLNTTVTYTVTANGTDTALSLPVSLTSDNSTYWLKNINREGLSMKVGVVREETEGITVSRKARILGKYKVLGRKNPIVISDVRGGREGDMKLYTLDTTTRKQFEAVTAPGDTLLIQCPPTTEFDDMYFIAEDITEIRIGVASEPTRQWSMSYIEVDSPPTSLSSTGFNSYLQVTSFGTYANLLAKRSTYLDLLNTPYSSADA